MATEARSLVFRQCVQNLLFHFVYICVHIFVSIFETSSLAFILKSEV